MSRALGVERSHVNQCLARDLGGKVQQGRDYRWRLHESVSVQSSSSAPPGPSTELARLCRYYLECVGQDSEEGVSTFAASRTGEPGYAELASLPSQHSDWDWWNATGAGRLLGEIRSDPSNLVGWIGYPVRLRKHRTEKWEGFFVEPVLLWPITVPRNPAEPCVLQDDLPTPNFRFLRSLAMGDAMAMVEEAARLSEDLGLNIPLEDQPETDELLERLTAIRPDWDWREPLDPSQCSRGAPLSAISTAGIYNRAVIIPGKRSPFTQGLETELKQLAERPEAELVGTALGQWLSGRFTMQSVPDTTPLLEVVPMNSEQRAAVQAALTAAHTVVTGPPGTGKSQVVTNLLVNAAWRGMKVLFASKNNKAVDVVESRVNGLGNRPVLLRLGSKEYQAKLASYLGAMLSGHVTRDDEESYQEGLERHRKLTAKLSELDQTQQTTLAARNLVDRLERDAEEYRSLFGPERFNSIDDLVLENAEATLQQFVAAIDALDPALQGFLECWAQ